MGCLEKELGHDSMREKRRRKAVWKFKGPDVKI